MEAISKLASGCEWVHQQLAPLVEVGVRHTVGSLPDPDDVITVFDVKFHRMQCQMLSLLFLTQSLGSDCLFSSVSRCEANISSLRWSAAAHLENLSCDLRLEEKKTVDGWINKKYVIKFHSACRTAGGFLPTADHGISRHHLMWAFSHFYHFLAVIQWLLTCPFQDWPSPMGFHPHQSEAFGETARPANSTGHCPGGSLVNTWLRGVMRWDRAVWYRWGYAYQHCKAPFSFIWLHAALFGVEFIALFRISRSHVDAAAEPMKKSILTQFKDQTGTNWIYSVDSCWTKAELGNDTLKHLPNKKQSYRGLDRQRRQ